MTYYLVAYSWNGNFFMHEFKTLRDIIEYFELDRYKDFMADFKNAKTEDEKIEIIENELDEFRRPFSPEDDSLTRYKIFKDYEKTQNFIEDILYHPPSPSWTDIKQ